MCHHPTCWEGRGGWGLGQVCRFIHPSHCSKPVCQMFSHTSPVLSVHIDEAEEKIFSIAFDNCVKV